MDDCVECVGGDTGNEANYTMDECGLCGGPGEIKWYMDMDEDGLGDPGEEELVCANDVTAGYIGRASCRERV